MSNCVHEQSRVRIEVVFVLKRKESEKEREWGIPSAAGPIQEWLVGVSKAATIDGGGNYEWCLELFEGRKSLPMRKKKTSFVMRDREKGRNG